MLKTVTPKSTFKDIESTANEINYLDASIRGENQKNNIASTLSVGELNPLVGLKVELPYSENVSNLTKALQLGELSLANRFVALPMEGAASTPDGAPSELSFTQYNKFASGGSGTIWVEAAAVCNDGRSNMHAFMITKGNVEVFKKLVLSMRESARSSCSHKIYTILQLTHAGRYSRPNGELDGKYIHKSPFLDANYDSEELTYATDEYLESLIDKFIDAAKLAKEAGFDAIDIKSCHGYLFSELLASHTREGRYGGSYENRTRLLKEVISGIKKSVAGLDITTRLNAYDGVEFPYGWGVSKTTSMEVDLTEPIRLVKELANMGVKMFGITIGYPRNFPHFGRPSSILNDGSNKLPEHPLVGIDRFIKIVSSIQKEIPNTPVVMAGLAWFRHFMPMVAAGMVEDNNSLLVGQGRGMFAYPNSVNDLINNGEFDKKSTCITCSKCSALMKSGGPTGCVIWDEVYKQK